MGIHGVMDIRDKGFLEIKRRDGSATNKKFQKQELLERWRVEIGELQGLLHETISVEYIPAVLAGETRDEANRRIRDVFVCINSYAKKTKAGETILLDESDGFSIIARRVATTHDLFRAEQRVNWANNTISKLASYLTTLDSVRTMARDFLSVVDDKYDVWRPMFKEQVPLRPTDGELASAYEDLSKLFDMLQDVPGLPEHSEGG